MAGDGADTYDLAEAKADAAALGINIVGLEDALGGDDKEETVFELWAENEGHIRAYNLLSGSFIQSIGATCIILSCPPLPSIVVALQLVNIAAPEHEAVALDLIAMCAEFCTITNKRLSK